MNRRSWHLFRAAILGACTLGVISAALLYLALFVWQQPTNLRGLFFAMFLGLIAGLGHGLMAALGGLIARRFSNDDRWTAIAAAGAVLVGWIAVVAALSTWISYVGLSAHIAVIAPAATILTAGSAVVVLRRSTRLPLTG